MMNVKTIFNQGVAEAVAESLSSKQKTLPSWLFYDEEGDRLFQQIMRMPEYYPSRCEYDILQQNKEELLKHFTDDSDSFNLIELGAGDGLKTEVLLKHFLSKKANFTYLPIDVSAHALDQLTQRLSVVLPEITIQPLNRTYEQALVNLSSYAEKKVILFMGANIGNLTIPEAVGFLKKLVVHFSREDLLLIGFDLKKDPRIILDAYDDPHGLTESFNLNILTRLNRELEADFNLSDFSHYPYYDPQTGTTTSFLMSMKDQTVYIKALGRSVHFRLWEPIQTEVSQKYEIKMIEKLMALTGLQIADVYYDSEKYFCDVLVKKDLGI